MAAPARSSARGLVMTNPRRGRYAPETEHRTEGLHEERLSGAHPCRRGKAPTELNVLISIEDVTTRVNGVVKQG